MHPDQIQAVLALLSDLAARIAELQPMLSAMLPPAERQPLRVIEGGSGGEVASNPAPDEADLLLDMLTGVTS